MTSASAPPRHIVRLGISLGLAFGFIEAAAFLVLALIPAGLSWRTGNSIHIAWVAPLVYGTAYGLLGVLVAAAARLVRRLEGQRALVALLTFLSAFFLCALQGQLFSDLASVILAAGLTVAILRAFRPRADAVIARALRALPWMAAALPLLALLVIGGTRLLDARRLSSLPSARAGAPSVLLLVMDTQRADHLSTYGYARPTSPFLDSLAAGGLLFERAYSSSSWTLPSHASLFTGRQLHEHRAGVMRRPWLDSRFPTIAGELTRAGYATGGFVANTYWVGRQTRIQRGFIHFEDFYGNAGDAFARTVLGRRLSYDVLPLFGQIDIPGRKRAADVNRDLLAWLDRVGPRPFFAFVNYMDVHAPYLPPAPFAGSFGTRAVSGGRTVDIGALAESKDNPTPEETQARIDAYDESIRSLDASLRDLFRELERRGVLDNMLVIITSDHGEGFGEHGMHVHGHSLYMDQVHVPLVVRWNGRVGPGRSGRPAGIDQVPATIAAAAGLPAGTFPGRSVLDSSGAEEPVRVEIARRWRRAFAWPASRASLASLITSRWQYIEPDSGAAELFDLRSDPRGLTNVAASPTLASVVAELHARLAGGH